MFVKGASITDKLSQVRSKMNEYQVDHLIIHRTDDVACMFYYFIHLKIIYFKRVI